MLRTYRPRSENVVLAVAILVISVGLVQAGAGAVSVGITTDEPTHVSRTQGWIADGWYVPTFFLVDGEPGANPGSTPYVYGPAFSASAHAVNVVLGNEPTDALADSKDAWAVRHLVAALIGVATAVAVGLAVWALTGSRRFALWGAAALLAIPIWLGMSFFNVKDIPAAAGYTFFTVGLLLALGRTPASPASLKRGAAVAALIAVGIFIGAGTRLALWAPLAASLLTFGVLALVRARFGAARRDPVGLGAVAIGLFAGIGAVVISYPSAFSQPLELLSHSLSDSADFPWTGFTLTAGRLLTENPPWWYLPVWGFASSPVLLFSLAIAGGGAAIWSMAPAAVNGGSRWLSILARRPELPIILVLQQALLLSLGSVVIGANVYTGLRQHLYILPAIAILAAVGAWRLWEHSTRTRGNGSRVKWRRRAAAVGLSAALIIPMAEQSLLFPYNYTYINPIAGIGGVNDRWETDYWWASSREGLARVPAEVLPNCSFKAARQDDPNSRPTLFPCVGPVFAPYTGARTPDPTAAEPGAGGAWVISRKRAGNPVPEACRSEDSVTRWLRGENVVMSHVLRCNPGP
jgi:hypothetical protein